MAEVVYKNKLLELIFGDYSYHIKFSMPYPVYSVTIWIDGTTPEEAVNQAIKYLRQLILSKYERTKSIGKVSGLIHEYMMLLKNKEKITKEIKEKIEKIDRVINEYIRHKFPIDLNEIKVPEINLNEIPVNMECKGNIESGIFNLREDYGLNYTYGEKECEGETELEFEWGTVILSKKKYKSIHDTEHCLLYDRKENSMYVTIKTKKDYKVVKTEYYESYSSFYHYDETKVKKEKILRATHEPIAKLIAKSEGSYSDRHTYSYCYRKEQYYIFPKEAKTLIKILGKDYIDYEIR